jgi:hypothetical protein
MNRRSFLALFGLSTAAAGTAAVATKVTKPEEAPVAEIDYLLQETAIAPMCADCMMVSGPLTYNETLNAVVVHEAHADHCPRVHHKGRLRIVWRPSRPIRFRGAARLNA